MGHTAGRDTAVTETSTSSLQACCSSRTQCMNLHELSALNELGVTNIYNSNINIIWLKTLNCQEHTVIAVISAIVEWAKGWLHDKSMQRSNAWGRSQTPAPPQPERNFITTPCTASPAPKQLSPYTATPLSWDLGVSLRGVSVFTRKSCHHGWDDKTPIWSRAEF
jgi:hypothetical protein